MLVKVAGRVDADPATGQPDRDLRRPAPAALLALQRPLPRRPAQPARHPARAAPTPTDRRRSLARPDDGPPPVLAVLADRRASAAAPARRGWRPSAPGAVAGTLNANAGSYTPFYLHLTRTDAEQEITSYSATLPRACSARSPASPSARRPRSRPPKHQTGAESAPNPSCPAASQIGHTFSGYGVGPASAYAPGDALPRRPLPRLAALGGRDRLRQGRPLRPRHGRRSARRSGSTRRPPRSRSTPPARTRSPTSSTASRCTCATSASTSTARTSCSTRPAATPSRSPRP